VIIDTHGHMIPPDLLNTIRKEGGKLSALRIVEDPAGLSLAFGNSKPSRPIMKGLSDLTGRLAWMDKQGIDKQVNGGWPDWFGSDLPPDQGERWCRLMNEGTAVGCQGRAALRAARHPADAGRRRGRRRCSRKRWRRAFRGAMISTCRAALAACSTRPTSIRSGRPPTTPAR
jgi:aminocarboxymuconate-semialdehyde decarboxylase